MTAINSLNILFIFLFLFNTLYCSGDKIIKSFKVNIKLPKHRELLETINTNSSVDVIFSSRNSASMVVSAEKEKYLLDHLTLNDVEYELEESDLNKLLETAHKKNEFSKSQGNGTFFDNFHPWSEIEDFGDECLKNYKHILSKKRFSSTFEKREIPVYVVTNKNNTQRKKKVFIEAGIHAREWLAVSTALFIMNELLTKYKQDPLITLLVDELEWHIVPVFNLDGYLYTWIDPTNCDYRYWRKNRNINKGVKDDNVTKTCEGVDLNRNFDWHHQVDTASDRTCSDEYSGTGPNSEVETQGFVEYMKKERPTSYISLHTYGQYLLLPYGHVENFYPEDYEDLKHLGGVVTKVIENVHNSTYTMGTPAEVLYAVHGSSIDWMKGNNISKYSMTFELRPDQDSVGDFSPNPEIIKPTGEELFEGLKAIAIETLLLDHVDNSNLRVDRYLKCSTLVTFEETCSLKAAKKMCAKTCGVCK